MAKKEDIMALRHSAAHIMAQAVRNIFPDAKLAIGPPIEDGFYYDFDTKPFHPDDLKKIEREMNSLIRQNLEFKKKIISKKEAKNLFEGEPYKVELIGELKEEKATIYTQGNFTDLCKGPHVENSKTLKAFKLTKIAGAYWKGKSENKQLQRIYGIIFHDKEELKNHLKLLEEAEKRDHRKLGKQLDLFSLHEEGPGFIFWHPKGTTIINLLLDFWREEHIKNGYKEVKTPVILDRVLWERSGHWANYKDMMYFTKIDDRDFAIKPMNCPGGILIFKEHLPSYRELPIKMAELGLVHRHELSGVLAGLFRVRAFTQDDAHIFMMEKQMKQEVINVINLTDKIYKTFNFDYHVELSTKPEKHIGSDKQWEIATNALKQALAARKIKYKINEGDGAFYGPKIDFHIKDCLGRTWQCATIQLDMAMPDKFDINYIGEDGNKHKVVMLHRTIFGSIERFLGILIEHYAGRFPLWLAPVQVKILTVADRFAGYAEKIKEELKKHNFRVEVDSRTESVGYKVRGAQLQKIHLILNVGEKEEKNKTVAVRTSDNKLHFDIKLDSLIKKINANIKEKKESFSL
ncbi:threonine--tRNA ligase [Candidatus Woesearchaeota archaeon]|nr:threonine--tRNA ligase [Candidatus Woesearchaeota archaeon]